MLLVLMEALVQREEISINFRKTNTKFGLNLLYNANNSYLFVNGKEIFEFKADK